MKNTIYYHIQPIESSFKKNYTHNFIEPLKVTFTLSKSELIHLRKWWEGFLKKASLSNELHKSTIQYQNLKQWWKKFTSVTRISSKMKEFSPHKALSQDNIESMKPSKAKKLNLNIKIISQLDGTKKLKRTES